MKTTNNDLSKSALQSIWSRKLTSMFSKFSTSVAFERVDVRIKREKIVTVPAYSSADDGITLVHPMDENVSSAVSIRRLKSLTIHELAHILYTPRNRSTVGKFVNDNSKYFNAFNILEDSRIENLIVARMSGVKPWLTTLIATEILNDANSPQAMASSYSLVYGRKYLDNKLIAKSRDEFAKLYPEVMPALHDIVDKYIQLTFHVSGDQNTAIELVKRFEHEVLDKIIPMTSTHNHNVGTPESGKSGIDGKRAIDKDMAQVKDMMDKQSDESPTGNTASDTESADVSSSLTDIINDVKRIAEEQVLSDTKSVREQLVDPVVRNKSLADKKTVKVRKPRARTVSNTVPTAVARNNATAFAKHLLNVKALSDPYWERQTNAGKLNVRNLVLNGNIDEAFDRWDDSMSDATDIEAVVLLDASGSMNNMIDDAYNAMWSIKRALDSIEASTTVLQYGSYGVELYSSDERAGTKVKRTDDGRGSTAPLGSLHRAYEILASSNRAIKMMLIITDGEWEVPALCEDVIVSMRSQGVITGLAFLLDKQAVNEGATMWWIPRDPATGEMVINAHRCEVAMDTTDPSKLVNFAKALADLSRAKLQNAER